MTAPISINVGGHLFTTLKSTLDRSPFLAALLSEQWGLAIARVDGPPFVDRNPVVFGHVLDFLRTSVPPIFWSRSNAFDLPLYAALLCEADYFQLDALATWIRDERYTYAIRITPKTDVELLSDCRHGLRDHPANVEKTFHPSVVEARSNSGKSTTLWKRVDVQTTKLYPPVSREVPNTP